MRHPFGIFPIFGPILIFGWAKTFQNFRNLSKIKNPSIPGKKRNHEIMTSRERKLYYRFGHDHTAMDSQTYETH